MLNKNSFNGGATVAQTEKGNLKGKWYGGWTVIFKMSTKAGLHSLKFTVNNLIVFAGYRVSDDVEMKGEASHQSLWH